MESFIDVYVASHTVIGRRRGVVGQKQKGGPGRPNGVKNKKKKVFGIVDTSEDLEDVGLHDDRHFSAAEAVS